MSRLIVDSPKALGLAMMAGTSERGFRTAGPSPKALGVCVKLGLSIEAAVLFTRGKERFQVWQRRASFSLWL
ncbi:hypothetical protein, partial [Collinsella sp. HCP3S3_E5]|uniref:hypothetical protein n=1 Tax=Collinsella sp. HCP3S3_E5 TaxID=3438936 RepID=UPI003F8AEC1C